MNKQEKKSMLDAIKDIAQTTKESEEEIKNEIAVSIRLEKLNLEKRKKSPKKKIIVNKM